MGRGRSPRPALIISKGAKKMKKITIFGIIFVLGVIMANFDFKFDWYSIKTFVSGGMVGAWIMILVKKH